MRLTRATLALTAVALAPALLLATPSVGNAATPSTAAVAAADPGSPYDDMDADDLRIAIVRILGDTDSGKRVTREANQLLSNGTVDQMRAWLKTGHRLAQAEDDRFTIVRLLADPNTSAALRAAANAALNDGTPETLRYFVEVGQYEVDR
ncbi:ALF repeat-containing protein [Streptomyces turgidiscabies]|uniref:Secreted protein n=1 Tax=Streptomyces turgidiscabies (strain Car8) TaxID=698760 RepID=L7FF83_STRT8|nr:MULTISPECIES: ALF repeat-containing protein [Streptomyces]ELP69869.1 hypothetical protein STRTUCAR8_05345 [Streptomyces turgidiscabies Car8]MDX3492337.1 ALF repeat-containing protein [Streptomyces turgidiscabies]GAQ69371.1 short repeats of unknown function [Streptomyces turgidiscabies]